MRYIVACLYYYQLFACDQCVFANNVDYSFVFVYTTYINHITIVTYLLDVLRCSC